MSTKKKVPAPVKTKTVSAYQPVWNVGYGSRIIMLAADSAADAIHEACERDYVLAALPLVAEPVITADGFHVVAEVQVQVPDEVIAPEPDTSPLDSIQPDNDIL